MNPNDRKDETRPPLPDAVGEDGIVHKGDRGGERQGDDEGAPGGDIPDGGLAETGSGKANERKIV